MSTIAELLAGFEPHIPTEAEKERAKRHQTLQAETAKFAKVLAEAALMEHANETSSTEALVNLNLVLSFAAGALDSVPDEKLDPIQGKAPAKRGPGRPRGSKTTKVTEPAPTTPAAPEVKPGEPEKVETPAEEPSEPVVTETETPAETDERLRAQRAERGAPTRGFPGRQATSAPAYDQRGDTDPNEGDGLGEGF